MEAEQGILGKFKFLDLLRTGSLAQSSVREVLEEYPAEFSTEEIDVLMQQAVSSKFGKTL